MQSKAATVEQYIAELPEDRQAGNIPPVKIGCNLHEVMN